MLTCADVCRSDNTTVLRFLDGLACADWQSAFQNVKDSIAKGLVPVSKYGKSAEEQELEAERMLAQHTLVSPPSFQAPSVAIHLLKL